MMDFGNLLGRAFLFICIGGLLLIGVIWLVVRALRGRSAADSSSYPVQQNEPVLRERGNEVPTYDSRRVESSGGFGNAPAAPDRDPFDLDDTRRPLDTGYNTGGPLRGLNVDDDDTPTPRSSSPAPRPRPRPREDDDDVRSGGGFGG